MPIFLPMYTHFILTLAGPILEILTKNFHSPDQNFIFFNLHPESVKMLFKIWKMFFKTDIKFAEFLPKSISLSE